MANVTGHFRIRRPCCGVEHEIRIEAESLHAVQIALGGLAGTCLWCKEKNKLAYSMKGLSEYRRRGALQSIANNETREEKRRGMFVEAEQAVRATRNRGSRWDALEEWARLVEFEKSLAAWEDGRPENPDYSLTD